MTSRGHATIETLVVRQYISDLEMLVANPTSFDLYGIDYRELLPRGIEPLRRWRDVQDRGTWFEYRQATSSSR